MEKHSREKISMEEYKKILLMILEKIDNLCIEYHLNYQLAYGTLLGAVRHGGFIPWDDDADIFMPRADYIKLQEIIEKRDYGINFISIETEPKTIFPYGKICASNTIAYEKGFKEVPGYGAFVDVFPLDFVPENVKKRKWIFWKYNTFIKLIQYSARTEWRKSNSKIKNLVRTCVFTISRYINTEKLVRKVNRDLQKLCLDGQTEMVSIPWDFKGKAFLKKDIYRVKRVEFENIMLNISEAYDDILSKIYGDYMRLPPEEERVNKHGIECYYKSKQ